MQWSELSGYTIGNVDTSGKMPDESHIVGVVTLPLWAPDSNGHLTFSRNVYIDAGEVDTPLDTPPSVFTLEEIEARYKDVPIAETEDE